MIPMYTNLKNPIKLVGLPTFLVFFFISFLQAQVTPTDWELNAPSASNARSASTFNALPDNAIKASISIADFKRKLQKTAQEIVIPTPEGDYETFLIEPTNVVAAEVAHLYTIKTFRGYKKDDPSVLIACDISDYGFHAGIYNGQKTYFIEPASSDLSAVAQHYIYAKSQSKSGKVKCGVANARHVQQAANAVSRNIPNTKRTYRLGVIASGEYGQQFGGSPFNTTNVLNALASGVNLINPIFLRDLGVEFTLVSTAAMVYSDPNTDPFDINDQFEIIELSHSLCVAALGTNGFDLGHTVVWENLGGLASLGVVCDNAKGEGFSGADGSVTTLWVDFVAHEIGHQFGAEHNFSAEECGASTAGFRFEPGEGSSIMAYANVCQASVRYATSADPYFHYASIRTMQEYIATTSCATTSSTGNSSDPVISAQNNITIPRQTPFVLVGSATDANDASSNLTYDWVQYDGNGIATTGSPDCNSTTAPLFRYRPPVSVPLRSFPQYSDVIAGNNNAIDWEKLPCTARAMNFSLTVRDNNPNFGRLSEDTMVVTVANTGPFAVTAPNGGESLTGSTANNITWSVNGTDTHCSTVDILLSTDGGATYTVIANATANDGAENVTIPNIASSTARILIRCDVVGDFRAASTFYDVSNTNFSIAQISITDADDDGIEAGIDCNDNDASIGAQQPAGTTCDDGNANTENDVILADGCSCAGTISIIDNDNDGFSSAVDCDDNNASINPGATDIPNNNIDENCDGIVLIIDNDNDGHNSDVDCDDNNATIGAQQTEGTVCNDGNANTENDVILADGCTCVGTIIDPNACVNNGGDADNDGVCANIDCNDNDATIGAQEPPGTICDDGNADTENDVILADGCSCAGTIIITHVDNDNDGYSSDIDCDDNNANINPSATEVPNNNVDENCDGIVQIIDNDNDGHNSSVDCDDNNASIGAQEPPGTACDDGNVNTTNDVILADGCSCAGTVITTTVDVDKDGYHADVDCDDNNATINPGATEVPNNNVDENCDGIAEIIDNDGDGQNSSVDCNDNDPNIGPIQAVGTPCDDGNSNTTNDVIQANGCTCAGTPINTNTDNDNDGYTSDVDCDDNHSGINPGATEVPNNNVDENCDGFILIIDNDNDGQNSSVDCNDNDPLIGPIQATGTPCDDGNSNTHNDVILANGCTCAGTAITTITDNDMDGYNVEVDCDDNNAAINPGATEIPDNGIDENCDGVDEKTPGTAFCFVPSGIHSNVLSAREVFIGWNDIINASSYTVQARFKGQQDWLVTVEVFFSKIRIFGPSNRDYEYRIRTNCTEGTSAYSDILEYSTTNAFSTAASSRSSDNNKADVIIAEQLQLTPNPVKKELSLQYSATKNATINIYHNSGQLIRQLQVSSNIDLHKINVSDLEKGLYILTIEETGKSLITKRFIKSN